MQNRAHRADALRQDESRFSAFAESVGIDRQSFMPI